MSKKLEMIRAVDSAALAGVAGGQASGSSSTVDRWTQWSRQERERVDKQLEELLADPLWPRALPGWQ